MSDQAELRPATNGKRVPRLAIYLAVATPLFVIAMAGLLVVIMESFFL